MADNHRHGTEPRCVCPTTDEHLLLSKGRPTDPRITESINRLQPYCSEFLIHAADNEGLQQGIDHELVTKLAEWCSIPVTYAGGGRHLEDLDLVEKLSGGKVDLTIGSALDVFGGSGVTFEDCVKWNHGRAAYGR